MSTDQEKSYLQMNSVFDWIERPLSTVSKRTCQQTAEALPQSQHLAGKAVTAFACEPQPLAPSRQLVVVHENTYQLEPSAVYRPHLLQSAMQIILNDNLQVFVSKLKYLSAQRPRLVLRSLVLVARYSDKSYSGEEAPRLCTFLADIIKDQAMKLNLPRYKFISDVTIGQKQKQGLITATRCLWDDSRDNFTSASFENKSLFAVATLYALNYE